jgi:hypothetical protein
MKAGWLAVIDNFNTVINVNIGHLFSFFPTKWQPTLKEQACPFLHIIAVANCRVRGHDT